MMLDYDIEWLIDSIYYDWSEDNMNMMLVF